MDVLFYMMIYNNIIVLIKKGEKMYYGKSHKNNIS